MRPKRMIKIKPGVIPWLRVRLAIWCERIGWDWAMERCLRGIFEVV